jgi:hypothetical protein
MHSVAMHASWCATVKCPQTHRPLRFMATLLLVMLLVIGLGASVSIGRAQSSADSARSGGSGLPGDSSGVLAGRLLNADDDQPVAYGSVVLLGVARATFADVEGRFRFAHLAPGAYRVRGRQVGYSPKDTSITVAPGAAAAEVTLRLVPVALRLPQVVVAGSKGCVSPGPPDSTTDPALAGVFAQLRENVDRFRILLDEYPFHYTRKDSLLVKRNIGSDSVVSVDTSRYESRALRPYRVGHVVYTDADVRGRRAQYMFLPTFRDLADSTFLATHCWSYGGVQAPVSKRGGPLLSIDFRPAEVIREPDVAGSIYLDSASLMVRRAVFKLTNAGSAQPPLAGLTVTTTYREIVPLVPLIDSVVTRQELAATSEVVPGTGGFRMVDRGALIEDSHLMYYGFEKDAPGGIESTEPGASRAPKQLAAKPAASQLLKAPLMPGQVRRYRLVRGPIADVENGALDYSYANGGDSIDVSLVAYDTATTMLSQGDTLDLLDSEYSVAQDTLTVLAQQNDARFVVYSHGEDQVHLGRRTYLGLAFRWSWVSMHMRRQGCDPSFLTQAAIRLGWSCYQQSYALPDGLLRIKAQLYGGETVANGELTVFTNDLITAIVAPH